MESADAGRLAQVWELCPDMICTIDEEGRFQAVSPAAARVLLQPPGALEGRWVAEIVHPLDADRLTAALRALARGDGDPDAEHEARCRCGDGSYRPLIWRAAGDPRARRVVAVVRDGTEAQRRQAKLRERAELCSSILEACPTFFAAIDLQGRILLMNDAMLSALGYEREEVIGQDYVSMFIPELDREKLMAAFAALSRTGDSTTHTNRVLTRDGRELLVEWRGRSMISPAGEFEYFFGVGVEIGERRRLEEALQRSEQRVDLHVEQTPLAVIEWSLEGQITAWNAAATRIFGYTREEALGQSAEIIVPSYALASAVEAWGKIIHRGGSSRIHAENMTKDGRVIFCDWYTTTLVDAGGTVIGVASLVDDVTEQRQAEEALRARERAQAEMIELLSAPVLEVWKGVLTLPVIGPVDGARAQRITETLLEAIVQRQARVTIIDLTGVAEADASLAEHVLGLVRAAELLGTRCLVSGISPEMARALTDTGADLGGVSTFGSLGAALARALQRAAPSRIR